MIRPQDLVYTVHLNALLMHRQLRHFRPGDEGGRMVVEIIETFERCERILRSMYVMDPTGL